MVLCVFECTSKLEVLVARKANLVWTEEMKLALVEQVSAHGAYESTVRDSPEDKFRIISTNLWKTTIFQGQKTVSWRTIQYKYQTLLKAFRVDHGLGMMVESAVHL